MKSTCTFLPSPCAVLLATVLAILSWLSVALRGEPAISHYALSAGSGVSVGGAFELFGVLGQADAGGPMSGATFQLTGGVTWFFPEKPADPPVLTIDRADNGLRLAWPRSANGWILEVTTALAGSRAEWTPIGGPYQTSPSQNFVTLPLSPGPRFFRLHLR